MKKIRDYKDRDLNKFIDSCIASGCEGIDIIRVLWQEIQDLKKDLNTKEGEKND